MNKVEQLVCKVQRQKEEADGLKQLWPLILPLEYLPSDRQFHIWLSRYSFDVVEAALHCTSVKLNEMEGEATEAQDDSLLMSRDHCVRYASGCMVNMTKKATEMGDDNA
jgi:hypothetical protein